MDMSVQFVPMLYLKECGRKERSQAILKAKKAWTSGAVPWFCPSLFYVDCKFNIH